AVGQVGQTHAERPVSDDIAVARVVDLAPGPAASLILTVPVALHRHGLRGPPARAGVELDRQGPGPVPGPGLVLDVRQDGVCPGTRLVVRQAVRLPHAPVVGARAPLFPGVDRHRLAVASRDRLAAVPATVTGEHVGAVVVLVQGQAYLLEVILALDA